MKRVDSVDVQRTLAIVCMLLCHFVIFTSSPGPGHSWLFFFSNHIVGDFAAASFLFLSGMSQVFSAGKIAATPEAQRSQRVKTLSRGVWIIVFGMILYSLLDGPTNAISWDILTLIGFATLVLFALRRMPSTALVALCVVIYLVTPWLRGHTDFLSHWGGQFKAVPEVSDYFKDILVDPVADYQPVWSLPQIVVGFLLVGFFPVFPWIVFPVMGYVVGREVAGNRFARVYPFVLGAGVVLIALGLGDAFASVPVSGDSPVDDYIAPLCFYPNSFGMLPLQLGITLVEFALLWRLFDGRAAAGEGKEGFVLAYCRRFGRYSLSVYAIHLMILFWGMALAGRIHEWRTGEALNYYENALSSPVGFAFACVLLVALYPLMGLWDRVGAKGSLEWLLTKSVSATQKVFDRKMAA